MIATIAVIADKKKFSDCSDHSDHMEMSAIPGRWFAYDRYYSSDH